MGLLRLYNLADRKALCVAPTPGGVDTTYTLPPFNQGDAPNIEYTLLQYNGLRTTPTKVDPGSYSLLIGLYTDNATSTQLAAQSTWTNDTANKKKTGKLVFDSSAVSTAMSTSAYIDVRLVIKVNVDGDETTYDEVVRLKRRRVPSPETSVASGEIALTESKANGTFLRKYGDTAAVLQDSVEATRYWQITVNSGVLTVTEVFPPA
jgi:hypothetical protein